MDVKLPEFQSIEEFEQYYNGVLHLCCQFRTSWFHKFCNTLDLTDYDTAMLLKSSLHHRIMFVEFYDKMNGDNDIEVRIKGIDRDTIKLLYGCQKNTQFNPIDNQ